jgi:hypothetical protein
LPAASEATAVTDSTPPSPPKTGGVIHLGKTNPFPGQDDDTIVIDQEGVLHIRGGKD